MEGPSSSTYIQAIAHLRSSQHKGLSMRLLVRPHQVRPKMDRTGIPRPKRTHLIIRRPRNHSRSHQLFRIRQSARCPTLGRSLSNRKKSRRESGRRRNNSLRRTHSRSCRAYRYRLYRRTTKNPLKNRAARLGAKLLKPWTANRPLPCLLRPRRRRNHSPSLSSTNRSSPVPLVKQPASNRLRLRPRRSLTPKTRLHWD